MQRFFYFSMITLVCCGCGMQKEMEPTVAYERGLLQMRDGDFEAALSSFKLAAEKMPNEPLVPYDTAVALEQLDRFEEARAMYDKCLELDPNFDRAYNNRAVIHARLGNHEAAVKDCSRAIELNRADPFPYRNRGVSHAELGNYQQAVEDFTFAMKLSPEPSPETLLSRAEVCLQMQNYDAAHADVDELLRFDERFAPAHVLKGMILRQQGETGLADASFRQAKELNPQVPIPAQQEITVAKPIMADSALLHSLSNLGYDELQATPQGPFAYSAMKSGQEVSICIKQVIKGQEIRLGEAEIDALKLGPVSLILVNGEEARAAITKHLEDWQPNANLLKPIEFLYTVE